MIGVDILFIIYLLFAPMELGKILCNPQYICMYLYVKPLNEVYLF